MVSEKFGPLLRRALANIERSEPHLVLHASAVGLTPWKAQDDIPLLARLEIERPNRHEQWGAYRDRVGERLDRVADEIGGRVGRPGTLLIAANAIAVACSPDAVSEIASIGNVNLIELDPVFKATCMDQSGSSIEFPMFAAKHPTLDGAGVAVAVLDSGIDARHPYLQVARARATAPEGLTPSGEHGTHCAGIIASRDAVYRGIAPAVDLLDIKVLSSAGSGNQQSIARGVDEALNAGAQVISMSLGFNHLPTWSDGGHGWACADGRCVLCTAVDNAASLDDVVAVVAAGNEHQRADALRSNGQGASLDTELVCPGQARLAITVGAVTKLTHVPAAFSSRGPTADRRQKPDLVAPGVNITSTIPLPPGTIGTVPRASLFGRMSGTSMATPMVSGIVALIIQKRRDAGQSVDVGSIRQELFQLGVVRTADPADIVGLGRLDVSAI